MNESLLRPAPSTRSKKKLKRNMTQSPESYKIAHKTVKSNLKTTVLESSQMTLIETDQRSD